MAYTGFPAYVFHYTPIFQKNLWFSQNYQDSLKIFYFEELAILYQFLYNEGVYKFTAKRNYMSFFKTI